MTVAEYIAHLQTLPQDAEVAVKANKRHSTCYPVKIENIEVKEPNTAIIARGTGNHVGTSYCDKLLIVINGY